MPNLKPIRRTQLISPFGVGAIVAFPGDESLMTAGLDEWPHATRSCPHDWKVREERLEQRLRVRHFRLPPDYREPGAGIQHPNQYIPFVRFPRWHYCPLRGAMEHLSLFGTQRRCPCRPDLDCYGRPAKRRPWLIPSRFIAICVRGHVEDFPFMEWVHENKEWGCRTQTASSPWPVFGDARGRQGDMFLRQDQEYGRYLQLQCVQGRATPQDRLRLLRSRAMARSAWVNQANAGNICESYSAAPPTSIFP